MSPLYSITSLRRQTHAELLRSENPVITLALHQQLKALTNTDTRHRVAVSLSRETTPSPIRSAKIGNTAQVLPDASSHWSWDKTNASAAKRVERIRAGYVSFFNEQPSPEVLLKLSSHKTWKAALTSLGLSYFLDLTPEAIVEDREVFLTIFNRKINS